MKFDAAQKYACAVRELEMRKRVYPRWVADKRMTQEKADQEIAMMAEMATDYLDLIGKEPAGPLFKEGG